MQYLIHSFQTEKKIFACKLSDDFSGFVDRCGTGKCNRAGALVMGNRRIASIVSRWPPFLLLQPFYLESDWQEGASGGRASDWGRGRKFPKPPLMLPPLLLTLIKIWTYKLRTLFLCSHFINYSLVKDLHKLMAMNLKVLVQERLSSDWIQSSILSTVQK